MRIWSVLFLAAVICNAQIFSLSGTVIDTSGNPVSEALVRLGTADISSTTDPDGNFLISNGSAIISYPDNHVVSGTGFRFILNNGSFSFNTTEKSDVTLTVYDISGRILASFAESVFQGNHLFELPFLAPGIHIYHVTLNGKRFSFKGISKNAMRSISASEAKVAPSRTSITETAGQIDDALLVTMDGFQLYRLSITTADTSGIQITLQPRSTGTITDIEGNIYKTVKIGTQEWTSENLRTTKYRDGTAIPFDTSDATWENATSPKYCYYGNTTDPDSIRKFGALYNWYVVDTANINNIAPEGWHVPSDPEWDTLFLYLIANGYNWDGTLMGSKMAKSMAAETDWNTSLNKGSIGCDLSQNNTCGFSALPGGERNFNGDYCNIGSFGYWLSTTEIDEMNAYSRDFCSDWGHTYRDYGNKSCGFSLRLVRDN